MLELYYMNFSSGCSYEQSLVLSEKLLPERKERVSRLKNNEAARKQILTGLFFQYCLEKVLRKSIADIKLIYNEHGKPYLYNNDIFFNMSHSGDDVVMAFCDSEVGVDIERINGRRLNVAKRCFCEEEYEDIILAGNEKEQSRKFLEYWTMKEAFVKCCGAGLIIPLNSFRLIDNGNVYIAKFVDAEKHAHNNYIEEYGSFDSFPVKSYELDEEYNIAVCLFDKITLTDNELNAKKVNFGDVFDNYI